MSYIKTLVIGVAIIDKIIEINKLPKSGDDIWTKSEVISIGGCAYNVSNILKNFEVEHDLVVPVGNGMYGSLIEQTLKDKGYEILIKDNEKDNGYCMALVEEDGERTFITVNGVEGKYKKEWLDKININNYQNIFVPGYELDKESGNIVCDFLEKANGKEIFFAPGPRICNIDKDIMNRMFSLSPIIHLNDKEALKYTGVSDIDEAIVKLHLKTKNDVFITLGEKGVLYLKSTQNESSKNSKYKIKVIPGKKVDVVDTIGAGDSHIASLIAAKSLGINFEKGCYIANKVASKVVQVKGGTLDKEQFNQGEYF